MSAQRPRPQRVPLRFRLGEKVLFRIPFAMRVVSTHFSRLADDPDATLREAGEPEAGTAGTLLRSHPIRERLPRVARVPAGLRYAASQYERCYVRLEGTFDDYLKSNFSSKSRSTLRRKVNKFAKHSGGTIDLRAYRTEAELEAFYPHARAVSEKTYQERLLDTGLPDDDGFRARMRELAARDEVRAYLLFHDGAPIAYLYCPVQEDVLLYEFLGHAPEHSRWSPGTVLQYLALEAIFDEGRFRMFDFTEGEGQHKAFFATDRRLCADLWYLRPTLRNRFLLALHGGLDRFSEWVVRVLDRLGLKARIKRWLRRRA